MKEYFSRLSNLIKAMIQAHAPKYETKEFEHLACDGAVCDPKHHNELFKDETLRVIDVSLSPHEDEIFHRHERCAVMYVDMPASIKYYGNIDNPKEISWSSNNPEPRFNMIPFEDMHKVENVDNKQFRAFRIELCADILKLQNHDALLNQILELIRSEKKSLDDLRKKILDIESHREQAPLLNQYPPKRKSFSIRKSEESELLREAKRFSKAF